MLWWFIGFTMCQKKYHHVLYDCMTVVFLTSFQSVPFPYECTYIRGFPPRSNSKRRHEEWATLLTCELSSHNSSEKKRDRRRQTEFKHFKVKHGGMPGVWPLCSLWSCVWCHPTAVCLGGSTHTQTVVQLLAPNPNCLSPPRLKVLWDFSRTKADPQTYLYLSIRPQSFALSLKISPFHTGFTHSFTRRSNFFFLLIFLKHSAIYHFWTSHIMDSGSLSVCGMSWAVCLIVGAIVWGTRKEWGRLFTQMVCWWRCEAGQLTVGTQRLLFLVSPAVF